MQLFSIGEKIKILKEVKYQFMGLTFFPQRERKKLLNFYDIIKNKYHLHLTTFLNKLVKHRFKIRCIKINDNWYEFLDVCQTAREIWGNNFTYTLIESNDIA